MITMQNFSRDLQRKEKEIIDFQQEMIRMHDRNVGADLESLVELPQELLDDERFMAKYRYYTQGNYKPKKKKGDEDISYRDLQERSSCRAREMDQSGPTSQL